jgi:hypothetical protein
VKELTDWINFWHFRSHQWGSHISQVRAIVEFYAEWRLDPGFCRSSLTLLIK